MEKKTRKKSKILPLLLFIIIAVVVIIVYITSVITKKVEEEKQEQINRAEQEVIDKLNKPVSEKYNQTSEIENNTSSENNKTTTYKGFEVAGTLEISSINLNCVVLKEKSAQALNTSICLESGNLNKTGNTTIVGRNTKNGLMFSNLKKISTGDNIFIKDSTGTNIEYIVYKVYETDKDDNSYDNRNIDNKKEISLYTNSDDNTQKIVVLAKEK